MTAQTAPSAPATRSRLLGLPSWAPAALALAGVPRVILHDLGMIHEGTAVNLLFVAIPPLLWIVVALAARVPRPLLTLLVVGLLYGVLLALTHQVLWAAAFPGEGPSLGGNLSDLDPALQAVILRGAAVLSGVATGTVVGALSGLAAEAVRAIGRLARPGR